MLVNNFFWSVFLSFWVCSLFFRKGGKEFPEKLKSIVAAGFLGYFSLLQFHALLFFLFLTLAYWGAAKVGILIRKKVAPDWVAYLMTHGIFIFAIYVTVELPFLLNGLSEFFPMAAICAKSISPYYYDAGSPAVLLNCNYYYAGVIFFLLTTIGGGLIGRILKEYSRPPQKKEQRNDNIEAAGRMIGYTERLLIFIFILLGQYEAIGLLVAAKSILRFGERRRDKQKAEYVLVGTFLSYLLAVSIGFLAKLLLPGLVGGLAAIK